MLTTLQGITPEEIDILLDAVDKWPDHGGVGELLGELMVSSMLKDNPAEQEKLRGEMETRRITKEQEKRRREEDATMLRAKLIAIKRNMSLEGSR